jgi:IclR family pca regulon transcriptional regulator
MTPLASALQPYTHAITERFNEPCTAAILDNEDIIYIARSQPDRVLTINLGVGARLPAYCTSLGRAMLAHQGSEWLDSFWSRAVLERRTPFTITARPRIEEALAEVRMRGFALVDQEAEVGLRSLAVPLRRGDQKVSAALTVTVGVHSMDKDQMIDEVLPELLKVQLALRHLEGAV